MRRLWVTILAVFVVAASSRAAETITGVQNFQIVARLTGPGAINNTSSVGIGGTDLGHMVNHNGKTYFLFGDTFSSDTSVPGTGWRHNAMAWSTDTTPANGIVFDDWLKNTNGTAKEVIRNMAGNPITEIPTGAISVNNRIYSWYMAVNNWGTAGNWTINNAGLSRWQEGDSMFTNVAGFSFAGNGNFGMVAASQRSALENSGDDNVYLWGTPSGRFGGVKLARVAPSQIENRSAYQFYDGSVSGVPQWTSDEFAGDTIVSSAVGEMSVMYNPAAGAWTMLYFDENNDSFRIRQSPTPWGNWSSPVTVASWVQAGGGLYAPYMNPLYTENGGRTIYFTYSLWDSYDVYLAKATLAMTPEPGSAVVMLLGLSAMTLRRGRRRIAA